MSTADIASFAVSMDTLRAQMLANMAALERQYKGELAAVDLVDQTVTKAVAPPGNGQLVDKRV